MNNHRENMPVIEDINGSPQCPFGNLSNRPRNSGPSFPFVRARTIDNVGENSPYIPDTRSSSIVNNTTQNNNTSRNNLPRLF